MAFPLLPVLLGAASLFGAGGGGRVSYPTQPSPYGQVKYPTYQPLKWGGLPAYEGLPWGGLPIYKGLPWGGLPAYQTPGAMRGITGGLSDILGKMARGETTYPTEDIYRTMRLQAGAGQKEAQEALRRASARGGRLPSGLYQQQVGQLATAGAGQQAQIARDIAMQQEQARRGAQQFAIPQYAGLAGMLGGEARYGHEQQISNLMQQYGWTREQAEKEYMSRRTEAEKEYDWTRGEARYGHEQQISNLMQQYGWTREQAEKKYTSELTKAQAEQTRLVNLWQAQWQDYLQKLGYSAKSAQEQAKGMGNIFGQVFKGVLPSILSGLLGT